MSDRRPTPDELPTAFFAKLEGGVLKDGNGEIVGVSTPSYAYPGAALICLRLDLLDKLQAVAPEVASPSPGRAVEDE